MKITKEVLKGLDVEAYIRQLIEEMQNMHYAKVEIPLLVKEVYRLHMGRFQWFMYYKKLNPNNSCLWYEKYEILAKQKIDELCNEVDRLENNLEHAGSLASIENSILVANAIQEQIAIEKQSVIENELIELDSAQTETPQLTNDKFNEFVSIQNAFLDSDFAKKETTRYKYAKTINFHEIEANIYYFKKIFNSHLEYDLAKFQRMKKVNQNAVLTVMKEAENTTFKFIEFLQNASFCQEFFYNMDVISEFATIAYYSHVAREDIDTEIYSTTDKQLTHPQKIILLDELGVFKSDKLVNLTNEQRDTIISLLIDKDETNTRKYINGLTSKEKAGNYNPYKNSNNKEVVNKLLS